MEDGRLPVVSCVVRRRPLLRRLFDWTPWPPRTYPKTLTVLSCTTVLRIVWKIQKCLVWGHPLYYVKSPYQCRLNKKQKLYRPLKTFTLYYHTQLLCSRVFNTVPIEFFLLIVSPMYTLESLFGSKPRTEINNRTDILECVHWIEETQSERIGTLSYYHEWNIPTKFLIYSVTSISTNRVTHGPCFIDGSGFTIDNNRKLEGVKVMVTLSWRCYDWWI